MTHRVAVRPVAQPVSPENATLLAVSGDIDLVTARAFTADVVAVLHSSTATVVVLDLSRVRFLACAGLSGLMSIRDTARMLGIAVYLVAAQQAVLRPLEVTALNIEFPIFDSLTSATRRAPTRGCDARRSAATLTTDWGTK